jgi:transcription elongation factor Elf1
VAAIRPSKERAERIARSHACVRCKEYSWKKLMVKPADPEHRKELNEVWHATLQCGVCGAHQEIGIDAEGDIVYAG